MQLTLPAILLAVREFFKRAGIKGIAITITVTALSTGTVLYVSAKPIETVTGIAAPGSTTVQATPAVILPAAPFVGDPVLVAQNIACNGSKPEKMRYGMSGTVFSYTNQVLDAKTGATAYIRWTDAPGLSDVVVVEINDQKARPKPNDATINCLKDKAKLVGGPIQ